MMRSHAIAALVILAVAGCSDAYPPDRVTAVEDDDPRMNAAIEKARSTVPSFIAALQAPGSAQSQFSIKAAFTDAGNVEHMWLTPVTYDGVNFHGTVSNQPEKVRSVTMGQSAAIAPADISDWMYIDNGKLVGGETLRVLRETLTPVEREDFDRSLPFAIE